MAKTNQPNVYVTRLNKDWVEFREAETKPKKTITYCTNKLLSKQVDMPNFRFRNVSWEGGRCLGADKFSRFEAFCRTKELTIPKVDETLKLPDEVASLFLSLKWRKAHGM